MFGDGTLQAAKAQTRRNDERSRQNPGLSDVRRKVRILPLIEDTATGGGEYDSVLAVELDATVSETHQHQADITEFPVEGGSALSDHRQQKPVQLTLEFVLTNTPIVEDGTPHWEGDYLPHSPGPADATIELLLSTWFEGSFLFRIETTTRLYESMMITGLNLPRDARTGESIRGTITFKQVKIATSKSDPSKVPPEFRGKQRIGKVTPQPADPKTAAAARAVAERASTAYKLTH